MLGININSKQIDFCEYILANLKTIETRRADSLAPYVGKRVGIVKTGCGKAMLVGYMTISSKKYYASETEFRADEHLHKVPKASEFDWDDGKWGYILTDVVRIKPQIVTSKGIIARRL